MVRFTQMIQRSTLLLGAAFSLLLASSASVVQAGEPCVEGVFFDLGNTLVQDRGDGIFELREGAVETVAALQAANVRLGIITNVPANWDLDDLLALLETPEFLDEFEVVILSSEAPASKPNPAIYTFAYEALAMPRPDITSVAFVGETLLEIANAEIDPTLGARSVGMVGIHLSNGTPSPRADYTIPTNDLPQIVTIVEESCASTSVGDVVEGGVILGIHPPSPNPGTDAFQIAFDLAEDTQVDMSIFDAQGRKVAELFHGTAHSGRHEVVWNGRGNADVDVASGVYYARLTAGVESRQVKVLKVR